MYAQCKDTPNNQGKVRHTDRLGTPPPPVSVSRATLMKSILMSGANNLDSGKGESMLSIT